MVDLQACINATSRQTAEGAVKTTEDLDRYRQVIATTQPDVIVETGTFRGGSACWFAEQGVDVVTIDIKPQADERKGCSDRITWVVGHSLDPPIVELATGMVRGRKTMVVLDSEHTPEHVRREIELYGPLVSPGCYLVVEDGICRWLTEPNHCAGGPLDAVEALLVDSSQWMRDEAIENLHPVTMHVMGWWRRA